MKRKKVDEKFYWPSGNVCTLGASLKKKSLWVIGKVVFAFKQNALKICWVRAANESDLAGLEYFLSFLTENSEEAIGIFPKVEGKMVLFFLATVAPILKRLFFSGNRIGFGKLCFST